MKTSLFGGISSTVTTTVHAPICASAQCAWSTNRTDAGVDLPFPGSYTLSNLRVYLTVAPSSTNSWTLEILKNGTSVMSAQLTGTANTGTDLSSTPSFSENDTICVKLTPTGSPLNPQQVWWNVECDGTGQPVFSSSNGTLTTTAANRYLYPQGGGTSGFTGGQWQTSTSITRATVPIPGTVSNFHCVLFGGNPGGGSQQYTFSFEKSVGGTAAASTELSTIISGTETADVNTGSFSVAADDTITIKSLAANTPTARPAGFSWIWTPTTDWQSVLFLALTGSAQVGADVNSVMGPGRNGWATSGEATGTAMYPGPILVKNLAVRIGAAPSSGRSHTYVVRKNSVSTALSATISNPAGTGTTTYSYDSDAGILYGTGDYITLYHDAGGANSGFPLSHAVGIAYQLGQAPVTPTGLDNTSGQTIGSLSVSLGETTIPLTGLDNATDEGEVGTLSVGIGAVTISPTGIDTTEQAGVPEALPAPVTVEATGLTNSADFGDVDVSLGPETQFISPTGLTDDDVIGEIIVGEAEILWDFTGFDNEQDFGLPEVVVGQIFEIAGLTDDDIIGSILVFFDTQVRSDSGFTNEADFGALEFTFGEVVVSVYNVPPSDELFGVPLVGLWLQYVDLPGLDEDNVVGTPDVHARTYAFHQSPLWPDLWADPDAFAAKYGVTLNQAYQYISKASWLLYKMSNSSIHGPACWQDVYEGVQGDLISVSHTPIDEVTLVEWMTDCGTTVAEEATFCVADPRTIMVPACGSYWARICDCGCCSGDSVLVRVTYSQKSTLVPGSSRIAEQLAVEFMHSEQGLPCKLPDRITNLTRQGVSWVMLDPQDFIKDGMTGVTSIDHWLSIVRGGKWQPVSPRLKDPLRGRFVSSTRLDCGQD